MSSKQIEFDESFLREARIGLMVVTVLMAVFVYVAYGRLSGWHTSEANVRDYQAQTANAEVPQASTVPPNESESRVALIPGHSEAKEVVQDVQLASAIESEPVELASSPINTSSSPTVPAAGGSSDSVPASLGRSAGVFKATLIPETETADPTVALSNKTGGDFDIHHAKEIPSPNKVEVPEKQQEKQQESSSQLEENKNKTGDVKLPWNLKLPSLRPAKPVPNTQVNQTQAKQDQEGPRVKTASSSSFIPGGGLDKMPKAAPARRPSIPAIPASTKTPVKPKANEPSPALGEFPGASPLPVIPASTVVEPGEGFWLVAQRIYGDGRFFDALYQANRKRVKSFNEVSPGTEIVTPSISELRQRWPYLCPRKVYKTKKGETLFEVASEQLGQASRYVEILKLNYTRLPRGVKQDTPLDADINLELPRQQ